MQVYVKLVNHGVHGVKLMIYQLAHCVNSCGLCVKMTVNVYKMLRVKGPLASEHIESDIVWLILSTVKCEMSKKQLL